ncbi:MAG: PhnD/SsuA/transferrin family substrate-binding protein [Eubacteriales bacterium]|nr:PhnD/SsuA/transferrin family substrate-binding protein [Eubacteriales bacterium]
MKKLLSLILVIATLAITLLTFSSCSKDETELRIGVLNGTTGVGIAKLYQDVNSEGNTKNYKITIYSDVTTIKADIAAGNIDVAAMPTTDAALYYASEYQQAKPIQMLAVNTLSVLYGVTSQDGINSLSDLKGKTVWLPTPEGQGPDAVFRALLKKNGIEVGEGTDKINVQNAANPQALMALVAVKGTAKIAIMPEPLVTNATAKAKENNITLKTFMDVGAVWGDENPIAQGCLVVRSDFANEHKRLISDFLDDYEDSVEYMTKEENLDEAAKIIGSIKDLNMAEAVAKQALPKCALVCIKGKEMKNTLKPFYQALFEVNESSIGKNPDDDFYYTK